MLEHSIYHYISVPLIFVRYRWTLLKTLEFLNSRRPDLEIRACFIHQLTAYENRLVSRGIGPRTSKWTGAFTNSNIYIYIYI